MPIRLRGGGGSKDPPLHYLIPYRLDRLYFRRSIAPGSDSMIANPMIPTTAFASAWLSTAAHGDGNSFNPSTTYIPMNNAECTIVAATNITNRGNGAVTMNCWPITPAANPTIAFASPPMPTVPLD